MMSGHMKFMKPARRLALASPLLAALLLSACAAPALQAPAIDTPAAYKEAATPENAADKARWKPAEPAEAQLRGEWWRAFGDATLNQLIDDATAANASLAQVAARVKQARALAGVAEADRSVAVGAQFGPTRSQSSALAAGLPQGSTAAPATRWQGSLTASYEVDLFGRIANNVSAAQADAGAMGATYRSALLALQADVAQTYFRLRAADAELALLAQTARSREETVRINQRRFDVGDLSEFDLTRARTELAVARADLHATERQRAQLEHALAVLLGKPASNFTAPVAALTDAMLLPSIPAGLPSSLLERRPDIAAAQQAMMAANARIGVARAARFPVLALTGIGGGESAELSDVFRWSSRTWLAGALLSMPLLDGGRNRANIGRAEAGLEEAVGGYRQTVLTAFAEVEDNLAGLRTLAQQSDAIDEAVASARRSMELAGKLHDAGRSSYLELLDAQRSLAAVERNAVQLRGLRATTTVALIRALGGGWEGAPAMAQ